MIARDELMSGSTRPKNLVAIFEAQAARKGDVAACRFKRGGRWQDLSWREMARRARDVSDGLAALGVKPGDRVAILGDTSPEWILADLGVMGAAAIVVPIYQSNRPEECRYILENSGARFVLCDSEAQARKIREVRDGLPAIEGLILFEGQPSAGTEHLLAEVERGGAEWRRANAGAHEARLAHVGLEDAACIIYTSGTTGNPKGVVLTHGNWVYEAEAVEQVDVLNGEDLILLFLPMAHSFAKVIEAAWFASGAVVAFTEAIEKIVDNAHEVHPTIVPAVPRIFEKAYETVLAKGLSAPGLKGRLFRVAMDAFERFASARERGEEESSLGLVLAKRLVFPKLKAQLGERFGGRMRLFVSGGAPLSPKINLFFELAGPTILEGYGLTETSAGTCVNRPGQNRIGTVGPPVPGTEVRIAEDGEILFRGGGVMKEYYRNPAATAEVIRDGWFYTGDVGELDADGYLRITDRKKDLIVTAGGKNVAPQNLENDLKTDPLISQVMVHGDRRKFLSALVTLNEDAVRKWAAEAGVGIGPAGLSQDPRVRARVQQAVDALNAKQASYSTIKKFAILPRDFTQEAGELTPTLKVKRKFCTEKYREILDSFYVE